MAGSLSAAHTPTSHSADQPREVGLPGRVGQVGGDRRRATRSGRTPRTHSAASSAFGRPTADVREQVAVDVVRLVDVGFDERDAGDGRVAGEQVEHDHPAAAGTDLEDVGHAESTAGGNNVLGELMQGPELGLVVLDQPEVPARWDVTPSWRFGLVGA